LTFTEITAGFTFATTSANPAGVCASAAARAGVITELRKPLLEKLALAAIMTARLVAEASHIKRGVE
jgi:hypothetical protein